MDNEKVLELVNSIEANLKDLAAVTGEDFISVCITNNFFTLYSSYKPVEGRRTLDFYREGANNE